MFTSIIIIGLLAIIYITNKDKIPYQYKTAILALIVSIFFLKFGIAFLIIIMCLIFAISVLYSKKNTDFHFHDMNFFKHYENMYKNWQHEHFPNKTQQGITKEEALKILGLKEGASEKEIKAAHVKLITKYHPDKADGSEYFAQKINQARDILLK